MSKAKTSPVPRLGFLLSVEHHELLLAFEEETKLSAVAKRIGRDPSVISRALQTIAGAAPLVEKHADKWRLTPLGRQINRLTKSFLLAQQRVLDQSSVLRLAPHLLPSSGQSSALCLLGTQKGFLSPLYGPRNNPDAETKMEGLLAAWRARGNPLIFCPHLSRKRGSPLQEGSAGCDFLPTLAPRAGEKVVRKSHNSAFLETGLEAYLREQGVRNLILAGFTTNHCVDATARGAFDRGLNVFVLSDAAATFDRIGPDGKLLEAETLHQATLASLHQEYATILETDVFLRYLAEEDA